MSEERTVIEFPETVDIMGTPWTIRKTKYEDDPYFKKGDCNGYCSDPEKTIVICDLAKNSGYQDENDTFIAEAMKKILRHEITHAYLYESGLGSNSYEYDGPWARNEEMVDWFALQGEKIIKTWIFCGCTRSMNQSKEETA